MASLLIDDDFVDVNLTIDPFLRAQLRAFRASRSSETICKAFLRGQCNDINCTLRHTRQKNEVCKHWLRGLCQRGSDCDYLHEFDMAKMPLCHFFSTYGECSAGDECPFLHIDPKVRVNACPWYERGFCRNGPNCRHKHVRKELCPRYLAGFCKLGPECPLGHPRIDLELNEPISFAEDGMPLMRPPQPRENGNALAFVSGTAVNKPNKLYSVTTAFDESLAAAEATSSATDGVDTAAIQALQSSAQQSTLSRLFTSTTGKTRFAGGVSLARAQVIALDSAVAAASGAATAGVKAAYEQSGAAAAAAAAAEATAASNRAKRNLADVTCFKCGEMGHFANACPNPRRPGAGPPQQQQQLQRPQQYGGYGQRH